MRCVAFLSDYGYRDPFVGTCHGVIKSVDSAIPIVDLTHGIPAQDVRAGAIALADGVPYLPRDAVVVAVVDPGVGGERRAVAVQTFDGVTLVGPDNGLLSAAIALRGGAAAVAELTNSPWKLQPTSGTFHGRDIFCPVAARLAVGEPLAEAGQPLDPAVLEELELPRPVIGEGEIVAEAIDVDIFGNVRLAAAPSDLTDAGATVGERVEIETGGLRTPARFVRVFADVAPREPLVFEDANGSLSIAINQGNAAAELGIKLGGSVRIITS
ncbi:MAG: SAM hydrolase/SAM-dependent halogenase family protein [Solirubrobacterales bacterium]